MGRPDRLARNQSVFRNIIERIERLLGRVPESLDRNEFLCECADERCVEHIAISRADYKLIREDPRRFAVAPGQAHVYAEAETIVARGELYWVVEKIGEAGKVAREEAQRGAVG